MVNVTLSSYQMYLVVRTNTFVMKIIIFITQKIKNWADKRWPFTPTPLCPLHVLSIRHDLRVCV